MLLLFRAGRPGAVWRLLRRHVLQSALNHVLGVCIHYHRILSGRLPCENWQERKEWEEKDEEVGRRGDAAAGGARNPESEIRNPKQIRIKENAGLHPRSRSYLPDWSERFFKYCSTNGPYS